MEHCEPPLANSTPCSVQKKLQPPRMIGRGRARSRKPEQQLYVPRGRREREQQIQQKVSTDTEHIEAEADQAERFENASSDSSLQGVSNTKRSPVHKQRETNMTERNNKKSSSRSNKPSASKRSHPEIQIYVPKGRQHQTVSSGDSVCDRMQDFMNSDGSATEIASCIGQGPVQNSVLCESGAIESASFVQRPEQVVQDSVHSDDDTTESAPFTEQRPERVAQNLMHSDDDATESVLFTEQRPEQVAQNLMHSDDDATENISSAEQTPEQEAQDSMLSGSDITESVSTGEVESVLSAAVIVADSDHSISESTETTCDTSNDMVVLPFLCIKTSSGLSDSGLADSPVCSVQTSNETGQSAEVDRTWFSEKETSVVQTPMCVEPPSDKARQTAETNSELSSVCEPSAEEEMVTAQSPTCSDKETKDDEEEDSWDKMFDDNGDCLDPSMIEELTSHVGKVEVSKPKKTINYLDYSPKEPDMDMAAYSHVIEISDFPASFQTQDLLTAFREYMNKGFDIKWVDDTHALGVFSSAIAASDALKTIHPMLKVKPLSDASKQSRAKAKRCQEFLQPYKPRPEMSAAAARRLVTGALGMTARIPKEKRDEERKQLKEAREKKKKERKQKQDIWDGNFGKCAMDNC